MGGPSQTYYVTLGSFPEGQKQVLLAYITHPAKFLGPVMVSSNARTRTRRGAAELGELTPFPLHYQVAALSDGILMGLVITQTWAYFA